MANYNISKLFIESKRNAYDMGEDGNQSYIISTFAILNNLSESKSRFVLNDYLFTKFLQSNKSNFDSFVLQEMKYKKEDTMIGSDIPQNVRPERPIEDEEDYKESLYEEDESDTSDDDTEEDDYEIEEDDSEDSDTSDVLPPSIIQFLKDTKLLKASDKEAKTFLLRFKDVISEVIDNEQAISLIILLLYKAKFEPKKMSKGEIEELEDIVFNFTHDPNSDTSDEDKEIEESYYKPYYEKDKKKNKTTDTSNTNKDETIGGAIKSSVIQVIKKYPITSVLVGGAALLGFGTMAITGWYIFSKLSNEEYKKAKEELINDDLISDIQKGEIQNIRSTIEDSNVIPDQIDMSDTENDENDTEIEDDSDTSQDSEESNTDDSSDDSDYPISTIDPVDGDRSTRVDSDTVDSDTSEEESEFDSYITQVIENEDDLKSELVSDTKERLQDDDVRQQAIKSNEAKRKYNKRNAQYWGKDKVEPEKKPVKKGDTSKDTKKKKPVDAKSKPSDTSKKKPIEKKGNTSKKKPDVKQPIKKSDTSKKPIAKKGDTSKKPVVKKSDTSKPSDTKPKPNENIDAYKKRTGKTRIPKGYVTDPKTKRITKKKESYDHYKLLF